MDAQMSEHACRFGAIGTRAVDQQRPAIEQLQPSTQMIFVTLGVAAEIVVIVENENARVGLVPGGRNKPPTSR